MMYLLLKSLHIVSVMVFIGGVLMLSIGIGIPNLVVQRAVRRWDRRVTVIALALTWMTGLTIALQGHWFGDLWLGLKLVLVTGLSCLHGVLSGTMLRMERDGAETTPFPFRRTGAMTIISVAAIVALVTIKHWEFQSPM